ncbi:hypothetical protein FHR22_002586 [Sphingopyxis panaciterrae]|uniref:hypothetical protein n=1 Tax=Sphingopyxis panaciterrae TaxID=363841 RepID=UPI001420780C|nr:hypothetical protein [Sphingopyxis panaciterrae]NIJ37883.1 hypothetical protein [Sphingopyxis panaciterrae]
MSRAHKPGTVELDGCGNLFFVTSDGQHVPYKRDRHYRASRRRDHRLPVDRREWTL